MDSSFQGSLGNSRAPTPRIKLSQKVKCGCFQSIKSCNKSFIINHDGNFKVVWDWLVLVLVIFTAIQVPFYAAFSDKPPVLFDYYHAEEEEGISRIIIVLSAVVDFIFIFDIFLNFRTTYVRSSSESTERNPMRMTKHYLKTWFVIDLLAAIPFDWIMHDHDSVSSSSVNISYTFVWIYLKSTNFRVYLFLRVEKNNISRELIFANRIEYKYIKHNTFG